MSSIKVTVSGSNDVEMNAILSLLKAALEKQDVPTTVNSSELEEYDKCAPLIKVNNLNEVDVVLHKSCCTSIAEVLVNK